MTLKQLHSQRQKLAARIRELSTKIEAAGGFDDDTRKTWDASNAEYDAVMAKIATANEMKNGLQRLDADDNRRYGVPGHDGRKPPVHFRDGELIEPSGRAMPMFRNVLTGEVVHALTADQTYGALPRQYDDDDDHMTGVDVGDWCLAKITNDWSRIPARFQASMDTSSTIIPSPISSAVVDLARSASVALRAGALTVPMDSSTLRLARLTGDPTMEWLAEGAAITPSDPTLDSITLTAKRLTALVTTTIELVEDSPNAGDVIRNALRAALGAELDRAILDGSGASSEPTGILTDTNVLAVTGVGQPSDYGHVTSAVRAVLANNFSGGVDQLAFIQHPYDGAVLDALVDSTGQPLQPTPWAQQLQRFFTTSMTSGEGIIGDFRQVLVGMRYPAARLEIFDSGTDAASNDLISEYKIALRITLRCDVAIMRPTWLCAIRGLSSPTTTTAAP